MKLAQRYGGVLFLDFDGVLNRVVPGMGYSPAHPGLDPQCVERVARVVKWFQLAVVVSSSWREDYAIPELQAHLRAAQGDVLANRLVGTTPVYEKVPKQRHVRHEEVAAWLDIYRGQYAAPYMVLDDSGKYAFHATNFVRTDSATGVQPADVPRMVAVLELQGVRRSI